ncbi:MAG: FMN-binding protein [Gammaproteobacteria bacterium]|nr:FMN-binding protein [Gammaproteobacteria bacterium]
MIKQQNLTLVLVVCIAVVAGLYTLLTPAIEQQSIARAWRKVAQMSDVDGESKTSAPSFPLTAILDGNVRTIYRVEAMGYADQVALLVAVNPDHQIIEAAVLSHRETPGLGDKIEHKKSNWLNQLNGQTLGEPTLELKPLGGSIDAIAGATITSKAVINAINTLRLP